MRVMTDSDDVRVLTVTPFHQMPVTNMTGWVVTRSMAFDRAQFWTWIPPRVAREPNGCFAVSLIDQQHSVTASRLR